MQTTLRAAKDVLLDWILEIATGNPVEIEMIRINRNGQEALIALDTFSSYIDQIWQIGL